MKKRTKKLLLLRCFSPASASLSSRMPQQRTSKSFLVLFFKKELLSLNPQSAYSGQMVDDDTTRRAPQTWLDAIRRGEADLAAGRFCDAEAFLTELEAENAAWVVELLQRKADRR